MNVMRGKILLAQIKFILKQAMLQTSNICKQLVKRFIRNIGMEKDKTSVVLAGSNTKIFNDQNSSLLKPNEKVKIVTHHWSSHANKGFKEYKQLDMMIKLPDGVI